MWNKLLKAYSIITCSGFASRFLWTCHSIGEFVGIITDNMLTGLDAKYFFAEFCDNGPKAIRDTQGRNFLKYVRVVIELFGPFFEWNTKSPNVNFRIRWGCSYTSNLH